MQVQPERRTGEDRRAFSVLYCYGSERRNNTGNRRLDTAKENPPFFTGAISQGYVGASDRAAEIVKEIAEAFGVPADSLELVEDDDLVNNVCHSREEPASRNEKLEAELGHFMSPPDDKKHDDPQLPAVEGGVLREDEALYRRLVEYLPLFIATFLPDGTLTYVNDALAKSVGMTTSELVGLNFYQFLSAKDQEMVRARLALLTPEHPVETHEQRYRTDNYHQWTNRAVFDATEKVIGFYATGEDITERKQGEIALRKQARYQRALLDNFPFAVWLKDSESRFLEVNIGFARTFGVSSTDELIGKNDFDIAPRDLAEGYRADDRAVLDSHQLRHREEQILTGGVRKWFETYKAPVLDDNGEVLGTVGFARDISERKEVEAALLESEQRFRSLMENIPSVAVQGCGFDGTVTFWNLASERLYGYSASEALGKNLLDLIIPEEMKEDAIGAREQMIKSGEPTAASELLLKRRDGSRVPVFSSHALVNRTGRSPEYFRLDIDLTERNEAKMALREQEGFFHLIAENISDFISVLDVRGRRLYNSPSYKNFLGNHSDLRGTDSFADVHPDDRECVRQVFRATVETGEGYPLEYRLVRKDGSVREMESRGNAIKDNEGRVERVVVVSNDVTERKRMEREIRQMAYQDALTKLPNRHLFNDRLNQAMAASLRSGCHGAVMFLDLDNFKALNDKHGHNVGDLLLIEVAERLKRCIREMDTVARFGGDEFVVMISELNADQAESIAQARIIAEKIRTVLSEPYLLTVTPEGKPEVTLDHCCTASIGVALFINHEVSRDEILKRADAAMYQAKAAGRNLIRFDDQDVERSLP